VQDDVRYDIVVVGAGIAGCTAAILYGRSGARVAVVERHADAGAYKRLCTHYIQASATPTIRRLGLAERIEQAGGIRNEIELSTRWGWIRHPDRVDPGESAYGYNIRREMLDPMLRQLARETPGVELLFGGTVAGLLRGNGSVAGVEIEDRQGERRRFAARLVVGADGRSSRVAELAAMPQKTKPNNRFGYWAYYRNLPVASGEVSQMWLLEPDIGYVFPNDSGLAVVLAAPKKDKLLREGAAPALAGGGRAGVRVPGRG
jgi:2-polyprenyl-6-methoxyphenol hydroxylase-like FAD-dependent oxidoreductase